IIYIYYDYINFFFFSSRRRHTRFSRDWSSDVCSSDLLVLLNDDDLTFIKLRLDEQSLRTVVESAGEIVESLPRALVFAAAWDMRSEERRVGKECRSRWWA